MRFVLRGLINGMEARVDEEHKMSDRDEQGEPWPLRVTRADFDAEGVCRIYARLFVLANWQLEKVQLVPLAEIAPREPWRDHKLMSAAAHRPGSRGAGNHRRAARLP